MCPVKKSTKNFTAANVSKIRETKKKVKIYLIFFEEKLDWYHVRPRNLSHQSIKKLKKMNSTINPREAALFANLDSVWNDIDFVTNKVQEYQACRNQFINSEWGWDYFDEKVKEYQQYLSNLLAERETIKRAIVEAQTK